MDARETALICLNLCQHQGGWPDAVLKKQITAAGLDPREGALAARLCFGVQQNRTLLDFYLGQFSHMPLKRMESKVVQILRLGAYQLLFLDKIPPSAAVNSAVSLARAYSKNPRAAGMVNGILRTLARSRDSLPGRTTPKTWPSGTASPGGLWRNFSNCWTSPRRSGFSRSTMDSPPPQPWSTHRKPPRKLFWGSCRRRSPTPGWRTA